MTVPGFTAEKSLSFSTGEFRLAPKEGHNGKIWVYPMMMSTCGGCHCDVGQECVVTQYGCGCR